MKRPKKEDYPFPNEVNFFKDQEKYIDHLEKIRDAGDQVIKDSLELIQTLQKHIKIQNA